MTELLRKVDEDKCALRGDHEWFTRKDGTEVCKYCKHERLKPQVAHELEETEVIIRGQNEVPDIRVRWLRSQEHIPFTRPLTFLVLGQRGGGKSSLLEVLAIRYPKIIDVYGASDNEGLCWCKPEYVELFKSLYGREPNILLVVGKDMEVASKWNVISVTDLKLSDIEQHDIMISVYAFFSSEKDYFSALYKITHLLWEKRTHWLEPWFVLIREASNWLYSRMKTTKNDMMAKAEFIKALRQARHHGLAIGFDTIRWTSLDKEVRDVSDYIFIKRVGAIGLPDDLRWMYRYVRPYSMMQARPETFMLVTGRGAVGFGKFDFPNWHKREKEHILQSTNIEVRIVEGKLVDERRYGITDFGHSDIIEKYIELKSMRKVRDELSRSLSAISSHIARHNGQVERRGECNKCKHAGCKFSKDFIITKK